MEGLKFSVWQLLVEAMASTSVAALIALVGTLLLAQLIAGLTSFEYVSAPHRIV
jgi:hypothetical protein